MNYTSFIVKIVGKPEQSFFHDDTSVTEMLVKFSSVRNIKTTDIFQIAIWGTLAHDVIKYYKINDYIIIEGYISLRTNNYDDFSSLLNKQVEISVSKIYPLFLKK